jgi:tetratricopeptide (TPR) repeat protein
MFVRTHGTNPSMRGDVARAYSTLGRIHELLGQDADAEKAYRQGLRTCCDRMRDAPGDTANARVLIWVLGRLSELDLRTGHPERAVSAHAETIRELDAIESDKLKVEAARSCLAEVHAGHAVALRSGGRYREALAAWGEAIELDPGSNRDWFLAGRAVCQASLGDHVGAAESAQRATAGRPDTGDVWCDAARALALCCSAALQDVRLSASPRRELADQYARRAMELLRLAAGAHMFTDFQVNLRLLETDRDLEPLRSRPDFQSFVAEQRAQVQRIGPTEDR